MTLEPIQYVLGAMSGGLVGFVLGLVGGGGSILAVPLMVYVVGVSSPHVAIGTSAFAVAANAATGLASHARHGHEGKGIGTTLIRFALDAARERGLKVIPICPFFAAYMQKHAEVQDLLDPAWRKKFALD